MNALPFGRLGTSWDPNDWSCGYDAVMVPIFHLLRTASPPLSHAVNILSPLMSNLQRGMTSVLRATGNAQSTFNNARNEIRDTLSSMDERRFPRHGHSGTSVGEVLSELLGDRCVEAIGVVRCDHCQSERATQPLPRRLGSDCLQSCHELFSQLRLECGLFSSKVTFGRLMATYFVNAITHPQLRGITPQCPSCRNISTSSPFVTATTTPAIMFLDTSEWTLLDVPHRVFQLPRDNGGVAVYRLFGAIYYGSYHWTSCFISRDGHVWGHDGQKRRGTLKSLGNMSPSQHIHSFHDIRSFESRSLSVLMYVLDDV